MNGGFHDGIRTFRSGGAVNEILSGLALWSSSSRDIRYIRCGHWVLLWSQGTRNTLSTLAVRFRGALFVGGSRFLTEGLKKFGSWQGVDDILFLQPAPAGHGYTVADEG